jgi:hypothetical protein
VRDICGAFGTERGDIGLLWIALLDIDEVRTTHALDLDNIAIATCVAMLFDFVIHELIAVPWAPLNFLVSLPGPLPYPGTTSVVFVYGTFRTVL